MSRPIPIPSSASVHDLQESKVVKHGSKIFTSTVRKEQSRQNSHHGSPEMSITSKTVQVTPTPSPTLSPILNEAKVESEVDSSNGVPQFTSQISGTKSRSNQGHQSFRSQSFSYTPSYNNYHKGHSRGFSRKVTGVNPNPRCDTPQASPDRSNSSNSNRVAALTGNSLHSSPNNRGGRRGGFNNRFPNRNSIQQNGVNMYPRYPTAQYMVPMAYPYYPGTIPMQMSSQPGTPIMVPDPACACNDCLSYFANVSSAWSTGYYPPVGITPQMVQQQVPISGDVAPRPFVPLGSFYQAPVPVARYMPDYAAFMAQQQAFAFQQQQVNLAAAGGANPSGRGNVQSAPESKNELTPIEIPGSVGQAQYGDNFYGSSQQPYYILPASALNTPANYAGDSNRAIPQPYNAPANGPGNTLPYTLRPDCIVQNTPAQQNQHKC